MPNRTTQPSRSSRAASMARPSSRFIGRCFPGVLMVGVLFLLLPGSAIAHHSHAMFDARKQVTLVGTVKELDWSNPHCWIQLLVPNPSDPKAAPVEWGIEMGAPLELFRHGWRPTSLKPGDKATVVINPLRDGRPGGEIVYALGPDGKPIGRMPPNAESAVAGGR